MLDKPIDERVRIYEINRIYGLTKYAIKSICVFSTQISCACIFVFKFT